MNKPEKPFKVAYVVRQKHGVIYKAIKDRGWTNKQAGKYLGINASDVGAIVNLKKKPPTFSQMGKKGERKRNLFYAKLALLTGMSVEDLFPDEVYNDETMAKAKPIDFFIERDLATIKLGAGTSVLMLPEPPPSDLHYSDAISIMEKVLPPRQWKVLNMRYLQNIEFNEIALALGVTSSAARMIEGRALRRLRRHPHILFALKGEEDILLNQVVGGAFTTMSTRSVKWNISPRS